MSSPRVGLPALTTLQPWTILTAAGWKDVENRTWPVPSTVTLPTRIGLHASARFDGNQYRKALIVANSAMVGDGEPGNTKEWIRGWWANRDAAHGALVGFATLVDCHHASGDCPMFRSDGYRFCSPWAEAGVWHWVLRDHYELPRPVPMRGRQRLWRLSAEHSALDPQAASTGGGR